MKRIGTIIYKDRSTVLISDHAGKLFHVVPESGAQTVGSHVLIGLTLEIFGVACCYVEPL